MNGWFCVWGELKEITTKNLNYYQNACMKPVEESVFQDKILHWNILIIPKTCCLKKTIELIPD